MSAAGDLIGNKYGHDLIGNDAVNPLEPARALNLSFMADAEVKGKAEAELAANRSKKSALPPQRSRRIRPLSHGERTHCEHPS